MAIRFPLGDITGLGLAFPVSMKSGWSCFTPPIASFVNSQSMNSAAFQPAKLTRPGNRGTAYIGVWTGNVSAAPLDRHVPIQFKRVNSLVAEVRRVVRNNLLRR